MKKIYNLIIVILLAFVLSACSIKLLPPIVNWDGDGTSNNTDYSNREKLSFYHLWARGDKSYSLILKLINEFNDSEVAEKANVYVVGSGINFWDYWTKVDNLISGGTPPDIFLNALDQTLYRASAKRLLSVTKMYNEDVANNNVSLNPFEDFASSQLEVATYNENLYALPWSSTVRLIYYNKKLFQSAGLTDEDIPTTWDELYSVSEALTTYNPDGSYKTIGFDPLSGEGQYLHQWAWLNGGDFWKVENGKYIPTFNNQRVADTLNLILNFPNRRDRDKLQKFMSSFGILGVDPFVSGKIGMYIGNEGTHFSLMQAEVDFEYDVFPMPAGPQKEDGKSVNWSSSFSIEMADNNIKFSGEKAATRNRGAWEFVKFLYSKDVQTRLFNSSSFLLSHQEYLEELLGNDLILFKMSQEIVNSKEKLYVPMAPEWTSNINIDVQEIYKGTYSVEEGLAKIQKAMENKVATYCDADSSRWGC